MSKVIVNKAKFLDYLKKGVSTALVLATIASFAGCANEEATTENETTTVTDTLLDDKKDVKSKVYDFELIEYNNPIIETTEVYDWSDTENIIRAKRNDFSRLINKNSTISENKYSVIECDSEQEFGYTYCRIVDNEGNYYNDEKYNTVSNPTANILVLSSYSKYSDNEKYTIFNRITGEEKTIEASVLLPIGKYLVKWNQKKQDDQYKNTYELLYADGNPATDEVYDTYSYDYDTNYLYLAKDGKTEVVDTITNKARKIDGEVSESENGFIVIEKKTDDKYQTGVFKLQDINSELEEIIPIQDYWDINIISFDKENPIFDCRENVTTDNYDAKSVLLTKTGKPFISEKHDYYMKNYSGKNTITGVDIYHFSDSKPISFYDVYSADGNSKAKSLSCNYIQFVPGTTLAKIQVNEDDKYGIVNCEDGAMTYIIAPKYDKIIISSIYDANGEDILDTYIIARDETAKQTDIFTKELEKISGSDASYLEAEDILNNHFLHQFSSKKLTKQND